MISAMTVSDDFVMSQNKMAVLVWGLCTLGEVVARYDRGCIIEKGLR